MARFLFFATVLSVLLSTVAAIRKIESTSLNTCMDNSALHASYFSVVFTPDNRTLTFKINGDSQVSDHIKLDLEVTGYGWNFFSKVIDPCEGGNGPDNALKGVCPMRAGPLANMRSNAQLPAEALHQVPDIIYYIPDLDGKVRVWINSTDNRRPLACVDADISNGKTVNQKGFAWAVAIVTGICLLVSALSSGRGHFTTSAHVAAKTLSTFSYFQAQALLGMTAITTPPIVRAWTQNFQWTMGVIRVGFLQNMATWYQRATGGKAATLLSSLTTTSVRLQKRANSKSSTDFNNTIQTLRGIARVSFLASIEITNIFFTSYTWFVIALLFVTIGVVIFKYVCEFLVKKDKLDPTKFEEFRNGWTYVLKGILFRLVLLGFLPMVVLCFWELTRRDSSAEAALAVLTLIGIISTLGWAAVKVFLIARRSVRLHQNPAYMLFSDPTVLNKWGFLYIQFRATTSWFILPTMFYALIKGMFVAFGQSNAVAQAIGFFILDLMFLVAVAIIRPYMDKTTNGSYISIASVNWFNSLTLLLFSGIFGVPPLGIGIMGVLYFLVNVVFTAVMLFMTIWAAASALFMKNPDGRYQPMLDDRGSFVKSQTNLETTELDALGATARGESRVGDVYSRGGYPPYSGYGRNHEGSLHSGFGHHDGGSVASGIDSYSRFGEKRVGGMRNYDAEWTPGRADGPSPSPLLGRR